jgi:CheY-like chemotaxis protein
MPGMDGTQAMNNIRSTTGGASRSSPVICFTADAVVGARERYLAEGFSDYITKPVNGHMLEKMLLKYLPAEKVRRTVIT